MSFDVILLWYWVDLSRRNKYLWQDFATCRPYNAICVLETFTSTPANVHHSESSGFYSGRQGAEPCQRLEQSFQVGAQRYSTSLLHFYKLAKSFKHQCSITLIWEDAINESIYPRGSEKSGEEKLPRISVVQSSVSGTYSCHGVSRWDFNYLKLFC